jgi:hypothetical protein
VASITSSHSQTTIPDENSYVLSAKSEVLMSFLEFKASVEKETGCQIKIIRSDNGGEYTSSNFQCYLKAEGITSQTSTPYTLEQNRLLEQGNWMIVEKSDLCLRWQGCLMDSGQKLLSLLHTLEIYPLMLP